MTLIRFGKSCDGDGCSTYYNDYSVGDIVPCDDCGRDLCLPCREKTAHHMVRVECCDECPGPLASCE